MRPEGTVKLVSLRSQPICMSVIRQRMLSVLSKGMLGAFVLCWVWSCGAEENPQTSDRIAPVTFADSLISLGIQTVQFAPDSRPSAAGPILELRIDLIDSETCGGPAGVGIPSIGGSWAIPHATAVLSDGERVSLSKVWAANAPCTEIVLQAEVPVDTARVLNRIDLSASAEAVVQRLSWASGVRQPM
jgi:hypothetical protein